MTQAQPIGDGELPAHTAAARWGMGVADTRAMAAIAPPMKLLLRVDEARAILSLNRNVLYRLLMSGAIYSFKEGGVRLIPAAEVVAYVERRLSERRPIAAVPALRHPPRPTGRGKEVGHGR